MSSIPLDLGRRGELRADCSRCVGLCCVALAFARSADFAFDKEAGEPCVHLERDDRCGIHSRLREHGFKGCTVFDCFGAGQRVTQELFGGRSWRNDPTTRSAMFAAFPIVRALHELLWLLDEAAGLAAATSLRAELEAASARVDGLIALPVDRLLEVELDGERSLVGPLLGRASALTRAGTGRAVEAGSTVGPGADLVGADLRGRDLRGVDLRGALLLAADLSGADLRRTDLLGADLRDADLSGADLSEALFLTQVQANAARGDLTTRLPAALGRPSQWAGPGVTAPRRHGP